MDREKIEQAIRLYLEGIGEDPTREGLRDTPERVARMSEEIYAGIGADPASIFTRIFNEVHDEIILVRDIPFYSMCEHHLLPFLGKAHVAYLPDGRRICGLSKLARIVELHAKRPQLQERLTSDVADSLMAARRHRGRAPVHDHARHQGPRLPHRHVRGPRHLPGEFRHPRRDDGSHPRREMKADRTPPPPRRAPSPDNRPC